MIAYGPLLGAIVPIFLIIGAGALARGWNLLTEDNEHAFTQLNVRLLYPCLVLSYTLGNRALMTADGLLGAPALGLGITLASMALAFALGRALNLAPGSRRTFAVVSGITNYGYLPIPLSILLFDDATTGTLLVYGVGVEVAMWTAGVMLLAGTLKLEQLRKLLNPPVLALAAAIVLNLSGTSRYIPDPVIAALKMLGGTSIPFALLLIGAILYDLTRRINWLAEPAAPFAGLLLRQGALPVAILAIAAFLPASMGEARRVLALQAAMPCGIFSIVLSKHYHGDTALALRVVLITTLAGVFLIPLWLTAGLRFLGLD